MSLKGRGSLFLVGLFLTMVLVLNYELVPVIFDWLRSVHEDGRFKGVQGFVFVFALVLIGCLCVVIPMSVLAVVSGFLFGLMPGFMVCFGSMLVGASLIYLLAQTSLRPKIQDWIMRHPALCDLESEVSRNGMRTVFLIRLSPIAPFGLASYAFGLSRVSYAQFIVGSFGSVPGVLAYAYSGTLLQSLLLSPSSLVMGWPHMVALGLGAFATLWLVGKWVVWLRQQPNPR